MICCTMSMKDEVEGRLCGCADKLQKFEVRAWQVVAFLPQRERLEKQKFFREERGI